MSQIQNSALGRTNLRNTCFRRLVTRLNGTPYWVNYGLPLILLQKKRWLKVYQCSLAGLIAVVVLSSTQGIWMYLFRTAMPFKLDDQTKALIGIAPEALVPKLQYDELKQAYVFNQEAIPAEDEKQKFIGQLKQKTGGEGKGSEQLYGAEVAKDGEGGLTFYDTDLELKFRKVSSRFELAIGRQDESHVAFKLSDLPNSQLIYAVKGTGIKENIVLAKPVTGSLSFSYKLELPESLKAKLLDGGSFGVYMADLSLFGNISFGSDADREKVDLARKNAQKTHLVFVVPKPVIKETGKDTSSDTALFNLRGDILTVEAAKLAQLNYPISIDPSAGIEFSAGRANHAAVAYNGARAIRSPSLAIIWYSG